MLWFTRPVAAGLAVVALVLFVVPAHGLMIAMRSPAQRAASADVVVVGKVTAIEKELVEAQQFPGAPNKVAHKVAVVKIETRLAGADNITHVKIAFVPPPKLDPNAQPVPGRPIRPIRPGLQAPDLKEGQELLFFLTKHPGGDFYVMPVMSPPLEVKGDAGKKEVEEVKKITTTLADPMKGLKSDKPAVRAETAAILIMKYRTYPDFASDVDQAPINAEESKLILQALVQAPWNQNIRPGPGGQTANAYTAFLSLGLTEQDGWKQPIFPKVQPGQPRPDFAAIQKTAFTNWLAGPGKDYVIKKMVPKNAK
jgi:hypothetical protein